MNNLTEKFKIYIIHVRGNKKRKKHIKNQLKGKNFDYEFILYGNMEDINEKILSKYFTGEMSRVKPATSCALKHIKAYEKIIKDRISYALILEDDIEFLPNFRRIFYKSLKEIEENNLKRLLVSYEDSNLKYVKRSEIKYNTVLYKKNKGRLAGAYGIDKKAAKAMVEFATKYKCRKPIDWFHNRCANNELINIYWSHPVIARQASKNGKIQTLIGKREAGLLRKISFNLQKMYKKILYYFR